MSAGSLAVTNVEQFATSASLDTETRDALALVSAYLTVAYDTIRTGPLGQEDARQAVDQLDALYVSGPSEEARATAREAAGIIRAAIGKARENAWDFGAFRDALLVIGKRIDARVVMGTNMAGAALDLSQSEVSWGAKVAEDERRAQVDKCSISSFLTGEHSLADAWECIPAPVKYGTLAVLGLMAFNLSGGWRR